MKFKITPPNFPNNRFAELYRGREGTVLNTKMLKIPGTDDEIEVAFIEIQNPFNSEVGEIFMDWLTPIIDPENANTLTWADMVLSLINQMESDDPVERQDARQTMIFIGQRFDQAGVLLDQAKENPVAMHCNRRQVAAILAGLRVLQHELNVRRELPMSVWYAQDVLTDGGRFEPLSNEEIDTLCEAINS